MCVFVEDCSKCCVAMQIVRCECTLFNVQQMIPDSICINIFYVNYVCFVWVFFLIRYCYGYYRCVNIYIYIFSCNITEKKKLYIFLKNGPIHVFLCDCKNSYFCIACDYILYTPFLFSSKIIKMRLVM